jgi:hypothetical protein
MSFLDQIRMDDVAAVLRSIWTQRMPTWAFGQVAGNSELPPIDQHALKPGEDYVYIQLEALRIPHVREGWSKYYPAVHCFGTVQAFLGDEVDFSVFTGPANLEALGPSGLDHVIFGQQDLLGPVPYWGGPLGLEIGLYAIKDEDLAKPFLGILGDLSKQLGGTMLSTAASLVEPLKQGIEVITGQNAEHIQVGYDAYARPLGTGYYAAIAAEGLDLTQLQLTPNGLVHDGRPLEEDAYFAFSVTTPDINSRWGKLPGLAEAWTQVRKAAKVSDLDQAWRAFRLLLVTSDDLIPRQRDALRDQLQTLVDQQRLVLKDSRTIAPEPLNANGVVAFDEPDGGLAQPLPALSDIVTG